MRAESRLSRPAADELLSSWLGRVATDLGFGSTKALLKALDWPVFTNAEINFSYPLPLLKRIQKVIDATAGDINQHYFSCDKKLSLPPSPSFDAEMTGYIWGVSLEDITRQVTSLIAIGCGSIIITRQTDVIYSQFQRELAFSKMLQTPAEGAFAFARYDSLALGLDDLSERLKKAVSQKIRVIFAESGAIVSSRHDIKDILEKISQSSSAFSQAKNNPSIRIVKRNPVLTYEEQVLVYSSYSTGKMTVREPCLHYGVSYGTIYRCLRHINGNDELPYITRSARLNGRE